MMCNTLLSTLHTDHRLYDKTFAVQKHLLACTNACEECYNSRMLRLTVHSIWYDDSLNPQHSTGYTAADILNSFGG